MSGTRVSEERLRKVEQTLEAVWEARQSPRVETAINGWPTRTAVAQQSEYHTDCVHRALIELAERGEIRAKPSMVDIDTGVEASTYCPETRSEQPAWKQRART